MKQTRSKLLFPLTGIVVIIWGIIVFNVIGFLKNDDLVGYDFAENYEGNDIDYANFIEIFKGKFRD